MFYIFFLIQFSWNHWNPWNISQNSPWNPDFCGFFMVEPSKNHGPRAPAGSGSCARAEALQELRRLRGHPAARDAALKCLEDLGMEGGMLLDMEKNNGKNLSFLRVKTIENQQTWWFHGEFRYDFRGIQVIERDFYQTTCDLSNKRGGREVKDCSLSRKKS